MFCTNCGKQLNGNEDFCSNCGNKIEKKKSKKNKKYFILIIIPILVLSLLFFNISKNRMRILDNLSEENQLKFSIDGNEFYLGDKVSKYIEKGYTYNQNQVSDENYLSKDSINIQSFYENKKESFLGTLYCSNKKDCKYEDSMLLKINFYAGTDVVIDDYIKHGTSYDKIVEKYGKETGTFYQDENLLIWSLGEGKIGEPYYILRFKNNWLSGKKVSEIRIGLWWYEDEYERTIIKGEEV